MQAHRIDTSEVFFAEKMTDEQPITDLKTNNNASIERLIQAALIGVDLSTTHPGAALVVLSCLDALQEVVNHLDKSKPECLLSARRAERLMALGKMVMVGTVEKQKEMASRDYVVSPLVTDELVEIADKVHSGIPDNRLLAEPKSVRRMIRQRQQRSLFFTADLFGDPAWDMLLDLFAAQAEGRRVSVTSLCIASGCPSTTALRWIGLMIEQGLLQREDDAADRRRAFISLTLKSSLAMSNYFAHVGRPITYGV